MNIATIYAATEGLQASLISSTNYINIDSSSETIDLLSLLLGESGVANSSKLEFGIEDDDDLFDDEDLEDEDDDDWDDEEWEDDEFDENWEDEFDIDDEEWDDEDFDDDEDLFGDDEDDELFDEEK